MRWQPANKELMKKYEGKFLFRVVPNKMAKSTIKTIKNSKCPFEIKGGRMLIVFYPAIDEGLFHWSVSKYLPSSTYLMLILDETYWQTYK